MEAAEEAAAEAEAEEMASAAARGESKNTKSCKKKKQRMSDSDDNNANDSIDLSLFPTRGSFGSITSHTRLASSSRRHLLLHVIAAAATMMTILALAHRERMQGRNVASMDQWASIQRSERLHHWWRKVGSAHLLKPHPKTPNPTQAPDGIKVPRNE